MGSISKFVVIGSDDYTHIVWWLLQVLVQIVYLSFYPLDKFRYSTSYFYGIDVVEYY